MRRDVDVSVRVVDACGWRPAPDAWQRALSLLRAPEEQERIGRFRKPAPRVPGAAASFVTGADNDDARASLLGALLMRAHAVQAAPALRDAERVFVRTKYGRPVPAASTREHLLGLSTNVSHNGSLIVLASTAQACASETTAEAALAPPSVGVDVMRVAVPRGATDARSARAFVASMSSVLAESEGALLLPLAGVAGGAPSLPAELVAFFMLWTAKEAVVKSIGLGLGIELSAVECEPVGGRDLRTAVAQLCSADAAGAVELRVCVRLPAYACVSWVVPCRSLRLADGALYLVSAACTPAHACEPELRDSLAGNDVSSASGCENGAGPAVMRVRLRTLPTETADVVLDELAAQM